MSAIRGFSDKYFRPGRRIPTKTRSERETFARTRPGFDKGSPEVYRCHDNCRNSGRRVVNFRDRPICAPCTSRNERDRYGAEPVEPEPPPAPRSRAGPGPAGLGLLIPGYPQWAWLQHDRALVLFGSFAASLGVGVFAWGTTLGLVVLGFAFATHAFSAADAIRQYAFPGFGRLVPAFTASAGLGAICYGPALAAASVFAWPVALEDRPRDGYLVDRWAYRGGEGPRPGETVWLRQARGLRPRIARVVAGPGQRVEWLEDRLRVDDEAIPVSPFRVQGGPAELSGRSPKGTSWSHSGSIRRTRGRCREAGRSWTGPTSRVGPGPAPTRSGPGDCSADRSEARFRRLVSRSRETRGRSSGKVGNPAIVGNRPPVATAFEPRRPAGSPSASTPSTEFVLDPDDPMDRLWAPWRAQYIKESSNQPQAAEGGCFLCRGLASDPDADRDNLLVWRGDHSAIFLNRYPYNNGHLLIAPVLHRGHLGELEGPDLVEPLETVRRSIGVLDRMLRPQGYNVGLNLGKSAGAGLPGHLHWHVVPRWDGDTNFMPVLGDDQGHRPVASKSSTTDSSPSCGRRASPDAAPRPGPVRPGGRLRPPLRPCRTRPHNV